MHDKRRREKSSSSSLLDVHRLTARSEREEKKREREKERKKRLSVRALTSDEPMKKLSAQPTGNGKRIIIITTLLPFRKCLQAVEEKKPSAEKEEEEEEKNLLHRRLLRLLSFFPLCKERNYHTRSNGVLVVVGDSYISRDLELLLYTFPDI